MANESEAAVSGGLLVILGIIVAVVLGIYFYNGLSGGSATDAGKDTRASVSIDLPDNTGTPAKQE